MSKFLVTALILGHLLDARSSSASESCVALNTPKNVVDCAIANHPNLVRGRLSIQQADSFNKRARQRPNPELNVKSVYGKNLGDTVGESEFNLSHTFEIGGKRSARMEQAAAEKEQVAAEFLRTQEDVYIFVLKTLYRIRQVHSEMEILDEALGTFAKIQKQFRSRPRLTPEQEVSLSVFQLAEGDYKLRKSALETEEYALERGIEVAIGRDFPHKDSLLPGRRQSWPDYSTHEGEFKGSEFRIAESDLKNATAEMELARSASWPDIKLGPSLQFQTENPNDYWTYGLNLTLPLPLFQVNGGNRAVAATGLTKAEQNLELTRRELSQERNILLDQYRRAVKSLKESVSVLEIEKKHKAVERQFERGVISSTLVIEAHRQMVDFNKSRNERELTALETLARLRALEGSLLEGDL